MGENKAGIDANIAILGFGFIVFAVFNSVFLSSFYRTGYKIGSAFLKASIGVFIVVALDIVSPHIIPWLDAYDPRQWFVLAAGIIIYAATTLLSCKKSEQLYEKVDL